jgi:hypothetical protein
MSSRYFNSTDLLILIQNADDLARALLFKPVGTRLLMRALSGRDQVSESSPVRLVDARWTVIELVLVRSAERLLGRGRNLIVDGHGVER